MTKVESKVLNGENVEVVGQPLKMDRLRIALVGCGGMANNFHLPVIWMLRDVLELVAVCDRNLEKAENTAGLYSARAYNDLDEMLNKEKHLDIVAITVHAQHHHTVAIQAAKAGKHIIVEKPIAITLPCADAMMKACKAHGVKLEVTENYLRMPMDAVVNKIARSGILDKVHAVQVMDAVNGGSIDIGVHRYSQLREAAGGWPTAITGYCYPMTIPTKKISKERLEWTKERHIGDTRDNEWSIGMVEFDNGVLGKCEFFPLHKETPVWPGDLRKIVGEVGVVADDLWPNVWPWKLQGNITLKILDGSGNYEEIPVRRIEEEIAGRKVATRVEVDSDPPIVWENPVAHIFRTADVSRIEKTRQVDWTIAHATAYYNFARAVLEDTGPEYGDKKGRNDLELTMAMYESARLGRRIELPLKEITKHEKETHGNFEQRYGRPIL